MTVQVKQALSKVLKFALAAGLIAWVIAKGAIDFSALKRLTDPTLMLAGLTLIWCLVFINNQRWLVLLRAQGIATSTAQTLPLTLIGLFFNFAVPGGVGGDVLKAYYLAQDHRERRLTAIVSILMDRLIGFAVMVSTAGIALLLSWNYIAHSKEMTTLATSVFVIFTLFVIGFAVCFSNLLVNFKPARWFFTKVPGGRIFEKVYLALHSYRTKPGSLILVCLMSFISQFNIILFFYMVGTTMGFTDIPFRVYCFLVPIGLVVTSLPLAPGGIGVGQAAFLFLFTLFLQRPNQLGPTAVTAFQIAQFILGLLGAYFYMRRGKPSPSSVQVS